MGFIQTKGLKSAALGIACHCRVTQLSPDPLGLTPTPGRGRTRSASCLGSGAGPGATPWGPSPPSVLSFALTLWQATRSHLDWSQDSLMMPNLCNYYLSVLPALLSTVQETRTSFVVDSKLKHNLLEIPIGGRSIYKVLMTSWPQQ